MILIEVDLEPGRSSSANPFRANKGQVQILFLLIMLLMLMLMLMLMLRLMLMLTMFRVVGKGRQKEKSNSLSPRRLSVRFHFSLFLSLSWLLQKSRRESLCC